MAVMPAADLTSREPSAPRLVCGQKKCGKVSSALLSAAGSAHHHLASQAARSSLTRGHHASASKPVRGSNSVTRPRCGHGLAPRQQGSLRQQTKWARLQLRQLELPANLVAGAQSDYRLYIRLHCKEKQEPVFLPNV